ncbi:hypothetical protein [Mucilaginibacter flavidus]|uniref:hypothetical protein n=1 Tax=Mucilaginibacter flavidus TaxID=2949309 RepID=UPI002093ED8B|nr:hypothetical protein [Mucilaginibacter flavidus]MCO5946145.1 hypothetical protein [Mucilaginibacter flavidus]
MNIEKRYWQWSEYLNESDFKLGVNIHELIERGLVEKRGGDLQYRGINEASAPWTIAVDKNDQITSIGYREFFFFKGENIGQLHMSEFIAKLNRFLIVANENYDGDRLNVVFRDSFFAVAILTKHKL